MDLFFQFLTSTIASIGFAIYFYAPMQTLLFTGLNGAMGWIAYYLTVSYYDSKVIAALLGSIVIGIMGEILSRALKYPATIFITTGIIPLVPGAGIYYTMMNLAQKQYAETFQFGFDTFSQAGAIAMGILLASIFSRSITRIRKQN